MKDMLEGLTAIHVNTYGTGQVAEHPVVRVHPETGRKSLYVNRIFTSPTSASCQPSGVRPVILPVPLPRGCEQSNGSRCGTAGQNGDVGMWDNRCTLHQRGERLERGTGSSSASRCSATNPSASASPAGTNTSPSNEWRQRLLRPRVSVLMATETATASVVIAAPIAEVFAAITDVTRMGDWSPENTACRWVPPATGPAVGAAFEGDNEVKAGPVTLKKWTTTSEITEYVENESFEFVSAGYTTWRFEFSEVSGETHVTETVTYPPYTGVRKITYGLLGARISSIAKGMQETLDAVKAHLEG